MSGDAVERKAGRRFLEERLPVDLAAMRSNLNEPIPAHLKSYWFALGGTPAFLLVVQVVTGIMLTFHYRADASQAYESVRRITEEVPYGWWIRSIHHWAAHLMILSVFVHVVRVFMTGAYRRPREFTWMTGCIVLLVTLLMGFTGYSLIRDQNTYWGVNVASNLAAETPLVGESLKNFLLAGGENGDRTVSRLFVLHIGVLPTLMFLLLVAHLALVRLHGVRDVWKDATGEKARTYPFWPDHVRSEIMIAMAITIILCGLAVLFPAPLREAADPTVTPAHVKPEWYLFWTFRTLKLLGLTAAMLVMGAFGFLFFFWPFVDGWIRKRKPGSDLSIWIGTTVVLALILLTVWESFV